MRFYFFATILLLIPFPSHHPIVLNFPYNGVHLFNSQRYHYALALFKLFGELLCLIGIFLEGLHQVDLTK